MDASWGEREVKGARASATSTTASTAATYRRTWRKARAMCPLSAPPSATANPSPGPPPAGPGKTPGRGTPGSFALPHRGGTWDRIPAPPPQEGQGWGTSPASDGGQ
ncbi:hypothetical protein JCM13210_05240 [Thermaerobacter litoralis]